MTFSWLSPRGRPIIVAHRGASAEAPENTMGAFRAAGEAGADAIELDVRLSKDGEAVVIHDRTLKRTTGLSGPVGARTVGELRRTGAGSWFRKGFSGETIPALSDVFAGTGESMGLNIELKPDERGLIVDRVCALVGRHRAEQRVLVSSFSTLLLRRVKRMQGRILTGLLYHPIMHGGRSPAAMARSLGAGYVLFNARWMRRRAAGQAHEKGLRVGVYAVDTVKGAARALRLGVEAVITNDPRRIGKYIRADEMRR